MAQGMKRILSILLLVIAIVALAGPSLNMGLGLNRIAHAYSTQAAVSDGEPITFWSCKGLGGKRVMPCQPDLGVLVAGLRAPEHSAGVTVAVVATPSRPARWPEAELPPPRLG